MSRYLRAMVLLMLVASCGGSGGSGDAPRDLDNACNIIKQRPTYLKAFKKVKRNYGVPIHVIMATIHQESKFVSDARPPFRYTLGVIPMGRQSSALGYSQALDATWDEYRDETGNRRANRENIADATDFMGWYMTKTVNRNGVALSDTRNQYLAYHEGHSGYNRGTYRRKGWLVPVANKVAARGEMYKAQLANCRVRGL